MFFSKFDQIKFKGKSITNITNSILLKYRPMDNATLYTYHTVVEGETAESLADHYYRNAKDHWVILLLNNIVDPYFDWALPMQELESMIIQKYGVDGANRIHHLYNLDTGKIVDQLETSKFVSSDGEISVPLPFNYNPVTNREFETNKNDEKRKIKILAPDHLQDFKNQFEDLMNREGLD